ncbi:MAG: hypothetical protein JXA89_16890 [Anaerolineae bacterium]|nr:hypothetical protein [Anaerolineae bacterium]
MKTVLWKKRVRIATVCLIVALSSLPTWAQDTETRYFEETGFNVSGKFLEFYDTNGGLAIFGYPMTQAFTENDLQVQYFQRVRMEKHLDNQIHIGLLGDQLGYRQAPIPEAEIPPPNHPDKHYFSETGHTVSFAFLKFFNENGGLDIFGYPISEWIIEANGRIVQYFQQGKMEWYPENPPGQRVQLGMLGTIYVEQFVDPIYRTPDDPQILLGATPMPTPTPASNNEPAPLEIKELAVTATPMYAIIGLNGTQTLHVYVRNQEGHGVSGASVEIQVQYTENRRESLTLPPTNANGYTLIEFPIQDAPPGYVVIVNLSVRYGDIQADTTTAFLPWW